MKQMILLVTILFVPVLLFTEEQSLNIYREKIDTLLERQAVTKGEIIHYMYPLGINEKKYFAYIESQVFSGRGDKSFHVIVIDIEKNEKVYESERFFIGNYYFGEDGIQGDWDDDKYSVGNYITINTKVITQILVKYGIKTRIVDFYDRNVPKIAIRLLNRVKINYLQENVDVNVAMEGFGETNIPLRSVYLVKNVRFFSVLEMKSSSLRVIILLCEHEGFEGDDFIDFLPVFFEQK